MNGINVNTIGDETEDSFHQPRCQIESLILHLSRYACLAATGQLLSTDSIISSSNNTTKSSLDGSSDYPSYRRSSAAIAVGGTRMAAIKDSLLRRFSKQQQLIPANDDVNLGRRRDSELSQTTTKGSSSRRPTDRSMGKNVAVHQEFYQELLVNTAERVAMLLRTISQQLSTVSKSTPTTALPKLKWSEQRQIIKRSLTELTPTLHSLVWFVPYAAVGLAPLGGRAQEELIVAAQHLIYSINNVLEYLPQFLQYEPPKKEKSDDCTDFTNTTATTTIGSGNNTGSGDYLQWNGVVALNSDQIAMADPLQRLQELKQQRQQKQQKQQQQRNNNSVKEAVVSAAQGQANNRKFHLLHKAFEEKLATTIRVFMLFLDRIQISANRMANVSAAQRHRHGSLLDLSKDPVEALTMITKAEKQRKKSGSSEQRRLSDIVYYPSVHNTANNRTSFRSNNGKVPTAVFAMWNSSSSTGPSAPPYPPTRSSLSSAPQPLQSSFSSPPSYDRVVNKIDLLNSLSVPASVQYRLVDSSLLLPSSVPDNIGLNTAAVASTTPFRGIVKMARLKPSSSSSSSSSSNNWWWPSWMHTSNSIGDHSTVRTPVSSVAGKWQEFEVEIHASCQLMIAWKSVNGGKAMKLNNQHHRNARNARSLKKITANSKQPLVWHLKDWRMEKIMQSNGNLLLKLESIYSHGASGVLIDFQGRSRHWLPHFGL